MKTSFYTLYIKTFLDITLAFISLVVLSPLLLMLIIFQIIFNGFPVFFIQSRIGKDEKVFKILKFRTMSNQKNSIGELLPDVKRRTSFGNFLRSTSLDELPSLINILRGEMSFIGPRPLLVEYLPLYNEKQRMRHKVNPGLSGLAQVNGRNKLTWNDKFNYDYIYVKNVNFLLDLNLIFRTLAYIFLRSSDVNQSDEFTSEKFKGDK
jgi:lipopolysaccharide/colanic/teichoic acid biosynthesis glycosyltransferase